MELFCICYLLLSPSYSLRYNSQSNAQVCGSSLETVSMLVVRQILKILKRNFFNAGGQFFLHQIDVQCLV